MLKQKFWHRMLLEIAIVLLIALILGAIYQKIVLFLLLAFVLLMLWHSYNLYTLSSWVWQQKTPYPPNSIGSFNIIFYGLHKRQKRIRQKQQMLGKFIKQLHYGAKSIPDSVILTNKNGKIDWCNKIAQYQLDIRWPGDKGQNIINLIRHPEFTDYIKKKDFTAPLTLLFNNKNYIEFRIIPYSAEHWMMIIRDVDQLYLAEKQRRDFFTNASHELRTPLTVVKGYLAMFSENLVPVNKQPNIITTMQGQVERMESLIGQILTLSQIENNPIKNQLQLVAMPEILQNIIQNIRQIYPQYHLKTNIDDKLCIMGHKQQLYSVVSNLIYNAIKHNPAGTDITICWRKTALGAYFSVTDNGNGIAKHHIHRLTERFYQVEAARTQVKDSSGLGLAIVKHALLNHANAKLDIKSELGDGSCFAFTLPTHYIYSDID
ncbi:phosphate regulon sensor histidine kinase PhoR [Orbus sturtevantii]|uniref:phosphate regulon sensor histidine kinase PhoR n=1 Tax=Orbus sturtevantii TaxID=3074109 RepID=UPI00370D0081